MQTSNEKLPHYVGHRKRQKDKFLKNPASSFSDYELIELNLATYHCPCLVLVQ